MIIEHITLCGSVGKSLDMTHNRREVVLNNVFP